MIGSSLPTLAASLCEHQGADGAVQCLLWHKFFKAVSDCPAVPFYQASDCRGNPTKTCLDKPMHLGWTGKFSILVCQKDRVLRENVHQRKEGNLHTPSSQSG